MKESASNHNQYSRAHFPTSDLYTINVLGQKYAFTQQDIPHIMI